MKLPLNHLASQLMKAFCEQYAKRDMHAMLNLFTKDCHIWGTALDEHRTGHIQLKEQMARDWQQSDEGKLEMISTIPVPIDAPFAAGIFKAHIRIQDQMHVFENLRGTIVLAREGDDWKIAHMHTSFPDFRNPTGESFPK